MEKRYRVCQTTVSGYGVLKIHGTYDSWFKAAWKCLKLQFYLYHYRTYFYIEKYTPEEDS